MKLHAQSSPRFTVGMMLGAIAVVHEIVGVTIGLGLDPNAQFAGPPPLVAMVADGFAASVGTDPWRLAITWFLLWGLVLALVGVVAHQSERGGLKLSRSFAVALSMLCVVGVVLMPASGFWLGFGPAWVAWRRARPTRATAGRDREPLAS
jgi:hypothetical protein